MTSGQDSPGSTDAGATVVITHRVREGRQPEYDEWLEEIGPLCRASAGHLDWQIVRPIPGLSATYTVIVRFDTRENLHKWMGSPDRKRLIEKVQPLLATGDDFFIRSGLDFWFTPEGARAKVPVRWKQYLTTWSAIFPLALLVPLVVTPVLHLCGVPENQFLKTMIVSALIVFLMVYVVMPRYTKLIQRWLFK